MGYYITLGLFREPPALTHVGHTSLRDEIRGVVEPRAKAAPLQAVGDRTSHKRATLFEDEDEYDWVRAYKSDQCNTTFPDCPDLIKVNASSNPRNGNR